MSDDLEIKAIQALMSALEPLDEEAQRRVTKYVFERLGLTFSGTPSPVQVIEKEPAQEAAPLDQSSSRVERQAFPGELVDIRTFAGEKRPSSQMEKTVLVAFYLSEVAPESDKLLEISGADLTKFQKQAGLGAPTHTRQALFKAKNAGYLEPAGHGKFKLNAVGYNFVAKGMPNTDKSTPVRKTAKKKVAKKKVAKKKVAKKKVSSTNP